MHVLPHDTFLAEVRFSVPSLYTSKSSQGRFAVMHVYIYGVVLHSIDTHICN